MTDETDIQTPSGLNPAWDALPPRRRKFLQLYLGECNFNATRAYIKAGYSPRGAHNNASRLMATDTIRAALAEQMNRLGITPERIQLAHAEIAFGNDLADFEPALHGMSLEDLRKSGVDTSGIKTITVTRRQAPSKTDDGKDTVESVKLELYDRQASLRELAKIKGMDKDIGLQVGPTYWHITITGPGDRGDQEDQDVIDLEPLDRKSLTASAEAP